MSDDFVAVEIGAQLVSAETARNDAEDLAWDHAKFAAGMVGVTLDSVEFEYLFNELRSRYVGCAEHLEYLTFNALLLLRTLLGTEHVAFTADFPITDQDVAVKLGDLAHYVVSAFAWVIAGQNLLWPKNDSMPQVGVTFKFPSEDIIITKD